MTIKELKLIIHNEPDDMKVFVPEGDMPGYRDAHANIKRYISGMGGVQVDGRNSEYHKFGLMIE